MKFPFGASSIVIAMSFFLLAGCDSLGLPNMLASDQVPDEVKDQPRLVATPSPSDNDGTWPRLGDVPFKPKTFSPKPVYEQHMDELEYSRTESEALRDRALQEAPVPADAAPQNNKALRSPQFPLD